jgi:PucR family transcriptional regulator, purine catabolism regulatory protein
MKTLRDVIERFGLPVRAGAGGADRPVRWVHLSESTGTVPWLLGGELVLTTGTGLDPAREHDQRRYVALLASAGIAGLGFAIGPVHRSIPRPLLDAAEAAGLPVLEVPARLPLDEIVVTVTAGLLRIDAAESRRLATGIVALTSAARMAGPQGIVTALAERIAGWAVLLDRLGRVRASVGAAQVHLDDARATALRQTRRIRHPDLQVHPVGAADTPKAHLVISARPGTVSLARHLGAHAAVLIDLVLHPNAGDDLSELARRDAVDVLLSRDGALARTIAGRWGLAAEALVVGRVRSRSRALLLGDIALHWANDIGVPPVLSEQDSAVTVVLSAESAGDWAGRVTRAVRDEGVPARCGLGTPQPIQGLVTSHSQADLALSVAIADGMPVARFDELPTSRFLFHGAPDVMIAFTQPLRPLLDGGQPGEQLLNSLQVFLAENGNWEAAAAQLNVHRHTLRHRIQRVEQLTGLSMAKSEDRFTAWLALRAHTRQLPQPPR